MPRGLCEMHLNDGTEVEMNQTFPHPNTYVVAELCTKHTLS